ncbi:TolC family protein (plasmid) [Hymenobacter tibetensis]|uniref:TolC family protein n=1 Tax=Hymenobacter tibetensis TaxID=497967 RepID=A0ABY4D578_9BACT|nr:TolC family protein [Hymenobacter tibetensis]UOG77357.1 TolC family protein [Hymenobacter tibetensis]
MPPLLARLALFFFLLAGSVRAHAQARIESSSDTIRLALPEAERRFFQNNLELLARSYNISIAQAQAVQARILENPTLSVEQDLLNRRIFRPEVPAGTPRSQSMVSLQQLVSLAGRRRAAGKAADAAAVAEQYSLQDLLRTLRFQLRSTFYEVYYKQQTLQVYQTQAQSLRHTVNLYQQQYERGNLALKEVVRLKSFLFGLESDQLALRNELAAYQADLHILLRDSSNTEYRPVVDADRVGALSLQAYPEAQLADSAQVRRADVLAQRADVQRTALNLRLQRTLAKPDITVGYTYDRSGSYINHYHALNVGVALPISDRNQGNIQTARAQEAQSKVLLAQQQQQVRQEVHEAYQLTQLSDRLYQNADRDLAPLTRLMTGIEQSYARRLISVVEYLDFYEAYKNNAAQLNMLRASRMRAFEQLNAAVGKSMFQAE